MSVLWGLFTHAVIPAGAVSFCAYVFMFVSTRLDNRRARSAGLDSYSRMLLRKDADL
jgi:hypothetical protein